MSVQKMNQPQIRWGARLLALSLALLVCCSFSVYAEEDSAGAGYRAMQGRETFRSFCSSCHGKEADGTGRVAQYLTIPPADLTLISERNDGEFPHDLIYSVIDGREKVKGHGTADMPVWGDVFQTQLASDAPSDEDDPTRAPTGRSKSSSPSCARSNKSRKLPPRQQRPSS